MKDEGRNGDTTIRARHDENFETASEGERLQLIVHVDNTFSSFHVPSVGEVLIGRGDTATVRIHHPSISRAHAVLMVGPTLRIRDLGSANGVRVARKPIDPNLEVDLAMGEAFVLGAAMLMVQRVNTALPRRRLQSHDYFEARVDEECARRNRRGGTFVVARVHVTSEAADERVLDALHGAFRAPDVLAVYAPHQYEILLDGASAADAEEVTASLRAQLARRGIEIETGIARYPADGATADALFAHLSAALGEGGPEDTASRRVPALPPTNAMEGLRELVDRVAASDISVLILGETGVGKEVLAETVHRQSPRSQNAFLRLNCAALSESLLESELFGHERGAFTGALAQKQGLLETADRGTVLLDEIGELPLATQVKLLRVIEERTVTRVGGLSARKLDVRFVAATNRDLEAEVARGTFRQDLFFRLNGITIVIPPLRERLEEIEALAQKFIGAATRGRERAPTLSRQALAHLLAYPWPGNIRELRNVMERAVLLAGDEEIAPRHLPLEKMNAAVTARARAHFAAAQGIPSAAPEARPSLSEPPPPGTALKDEIEALQRRRILRALEQSSWNQTKAAQLLGLSRGVLMTRLDQYGIGRPRKRGTG